MRQSITLAALFLSSIAVACGGKVGSSIDDTGSSGDPSPSPTPTSSPAPLPPPPSGPGPTPTPLPPKPSAGTYPAYAWGGGLDHVEIFKADFAANSCVHLHLASPGQPSSTGAFAGLKTPATWTVTTGDRSNDAANCKALAPRPAGILAVDGKGLITWDSNPNPLPCTLNIHASIIFDKLKVAEQLDADNLAVDGCK